MKRTNELYLYFLEKYSVDFSTKLKIVARLARLAYLASIKSQPNI